MQRNDLIGREAGTLAHRREIWREVARVTDRNLDDAGIERWCASEVCQSLLEGARQRRMRCVHRRPADDGGVIMDSDAGESGDQLDDRRVRAAESLKCGAHPLEDAAVDPIAELNDQRPVA